MNDDEGEFWDWLKRRSEDVFTQWEQHASEGFCIKGIDIAVESYRCGGRMRPLNDAEVEWLSRNRSASRVYGRCTVCDSFGCRSDRDGRVSGWFWSVDAPAAARVSSGTGDEGMSDKAKAIVDDIFADLLDRKGFDWWWDEIESSTRSVIQRALRRIVEKYLATEEAE